MQTGGASIQRVGRLPQELGDFFEHWLGLSPDGLVPALGAFLDKPHPVAQPYTVILDVTGPTSVEVRFFGTGLETAYGRDMTHATAMQWYSDFTRDLMIDLNGHLLAAPCGLACLRTYRTSTGRRVMVGSLSLPLRRDGAINSLAVYIGLRGMLSRDETATEIVDISDARWIDFGYGVPEKSAEQLIEDFKARSSAFKRKTAGLAGAYLNYFRRLWGRSDIARLLAGTGDAEVAAFYNHWASLRKGRVVPRLRDFLDHPQPRFQPHLTIVDVDPEGRASVRLMGSERHDLGAEPVKGVESMRVVYSPRLYPKLYAVSQECVNRPCGFRAQRTFESGDGREYRGAVITLPLAVDDAKTRTFVHFQHLLGPKAYSGSAQVVTAIHNPQWIDIGAGVPEDFEP